MQNKGTCDRDSVIESTTFVFCLSPTCGPTAGTQLFLRGFWLAATVLSAVNRVWVRQVVRWAPLNHTGGRAGPQGASGKPGQTLRGGVGPHELKDTDVW